MECINQVVLQGVVGSSRMNEFSGRRIARFTVCTTRAYKDSSNNPILESTWHEVTAFESKDNQLDAVGKGAKVRVEGFIRNIRHTDANGNEHCSVEIVAKKVTAIS